MLVATSDIFAYFTGKLIGRTKLTHLSPKKTVEGVIGGFLFTAFAGVIGMLLKLKYNIYDDGNDLVILAKKVTKFNIPAFYLHTLSFVLFASFMAPFGGLLASAIKRLFKIKDFASYLPGHGGIMDRIHCQLLMGIFIRLYIGSFIVKQRISSNKIADIIISNYNKKGIRVIALKILSSILRNNKDM